jgi:hypothetical protein
MIKLRRIRWAGHVAQMGEKSNTYMLLVERNRQMDNIKMNAGKFLSDCTTGGLSSSAKPNSVSE